MSEHDLLNAAKALSPALTDLRRRLHACPEIGFNLPRTTSIVCKELERLKIPFKKTGRGSIVADLGKKTKDTVLLRADMDGLPLRENATIPFRSENGCMHACGHDLHTTMLLGAAALLKDRESLLSQGVRLFFQPAEEILQGAADGVSSGVTESVSRAYMIHVTVGSDLPAGTVVIPPAGITAPSADFFEVRVKGKGCHGADPASGVDPLSTAAQILMALQHLSAREIPSGARGTITVGAIQGGEAYNVIPDTALIKGTSRCYDEELRAYLKNRIREISTSIATAFRANATVSFPEGCPCLVNSNEARNEAKILLSKLIEPSALMVIDTPSGTAGSEDFAVITQAVPSLMLALAAGDCGYPLHHPKVIFDESVLPVGAATLACLALK